MKKRVLLLVLLIAAVIALIWVAETSFRRTGARAPHLYGNVDIREVNLGFRVAGRLIEVLKDEGDAVEAGTVLAKLDDEPYRHAAGEAQGRLAAARARLQMLEAGYRTQEVAQAAATLREREVTAQNAATLFKRQQELFAAQTVSIQERDDAEARNREAEARRKSAAAQLDLFQAGYRVEEIAQARADLTRAEAALASAELNVADTVLKAPAGGVVLTRAQEPGAVLQPGATVLTVSLTRPVWVRAYIGEPDLGRIHPGLKVAFRADSIPGKTYKGQVGFVSPRAEFTPKSVETAELRTSLVYRLRIVVEDPDDALRQGMPVTISLDN